MRVNPCPPTMALIARTESAPAVTERKNGHGNQQGTSGALGAGGSRLPPRPDEAPGAIAWSEDGQLEHLAALAGLTPVAVTDVSNPLIYPDLATAVRTQLSSGPARAAIQHSGLAATRGALTRAFAGSRKPDGTYRQENVFRYLVART
jgi:hypothetical protein